MLYTVVGLDFVFATDIQTKTENKQSVRSSNPYDYLRSGYYIDNAVLFGGNNNVNYNCNFPSNRSSTNLAASHK